MPFTGIHMYMYSIDLHMYIYIYIYVQNPSRSGKNYEDDVCCSWALPLCIWKMTWAMNIPYYWDLSCITIHSSLLISSIYITRDQYSTFYV